MGPKSKDKLSLPKKKKGKGRFETQRRRQCEDGSRDCSKAGTRNANLPRKLEEAKNRLSPRASGGMQPRQHLDFRLLAYGTVRE